MLRSSSWVRLSVTAVVIALLGVAAAPAPAAAQEDVGKKTLRFDVRVGPDDATRCEIVGDLWTPPGVSARRPAPALLMTNGFGGSKDGLGRAARGYAERGYVVLAYSGLGFGGSGCKITLDNREHDGRAASQLITFLGGGSAAKDGTRIDSVLLDARAADGSTRAHDPRVGMVGGSYGGQIQFATAAIDPRLDTIVPQITWNDLAYALAPNNTSLRDGTVFYDTPGVQKFMWTTFFFAVGISRGLEEAESDPARLVGCPNFADPACAMKLQMDVSGAPDTTTLAFARNASVASYIDDIRIPVFLQQGQADTLFNFQESLATYRALKARKVPVRLFWHEWGHSGPPAQGEIDENAPELGYETRQTLAWLDHHLKGSGPPPPLDFQVFRDWIRYNGDAGVAYAVAPSYPVGSTRTFRLDGTDALVSGDAPVRPGVSGFVPPPLGAPASVTEVSAVTQDVPLVDVPGTFASYTSAPLESDIVSIGVPRLTVRIAAAPSSEPPLMPVVFVKLYDVAPDGSVTLPHRLVAPVRVADPSRPVTIELPGLAYRYRAGHRLRLVVAASDAAYRGNTSPLPIEVRTGPDAPGTLELPVEGDTGLPTGLAAERAAARAARRAACLSQRTIRYRVALRRGERVVRSVVTVNGKRLAVRRGRSLPTTVVLAGRPRGTAKVRASFRTNRGRTIVRRGTYRLCVKAKRRAAPGQVPGAVAGRGGPTPAPGRPVAGP